MASKTSSKKVVKNEDCVKTRSILDRERFLEQQNNSEVAEKIIRGFEDNGLLSFVTFDYGCVNKKEVVELYFNASPSNNQITSKVGEYDVVITLVRTTFDLPEGSKLAVCTHTFNQKTFKEIRNEGALSYVKFSGKKKVLLIEAHTGKRNRYCLQMPRIQGCRGR